MTKKMSAQAFNKKQRDMLPNAYFILGIFVLPLASEFLNLVHELAAKEGPTAQLIYFIAVSAGMVYFSWMAVELFQEVYGRK